MADITDITDMTEPELCMAVAKKWLPAKQHRFLKIKKCRHQGEYVEYLGSKYDPLENPSDAWPIIDEHNIDLRHGYEEQGIPCALIGDDDDYLFWYSDKNRIRAAMIVYLMMGKGDE